MSLKINNVEFVELIDKARQGNAVPLNRFLRQLYLDGKQSLLSLTHSETEAEEYFAVAIAKFWEKFVIGKAPLPETNIGGYIYTIAKFLCLDHKRNTAKIKTTIPIDSVVGNRKEMGETPKAETLFKEEEQFEQIQRDALKRALADLGENCRNLFNTMMEKGLEKSRDLYEILGLKDARAVTVLRYECTKRLKIKAAIQLEMLVKQAK